MGPAWKRWLVTAIWLGCGACIRAEGEPCQIALDLERDDKSCGACGNECPQGRHCVHGQCACSSGAECDGECVNLYSDPRNCGACGVVCAGLSYCSNNVCTCRGAWCDDICVHVDSDPENCGTCGNACGDRYTCVNGQCMPHCVGMPDKCAYRTQQDCANGCVWVSSGCGGGEKSCSPMSSWTECSKVDGCTWSTTACEGTFVCEEFNSETCHAYCINGPHCEGAPMPCEGLSFEECKTSPGCSYE